MRTILILSVGCALAAAGCGSDGSGDTRTVVATTALAADIVRQVAGPDVQVEQLLPGSASPHGFSPSAKDRAKLEDADLVVAWGSGLEEGLPLDGLDTFELAAAHDDPHVWMDPTLIVRALPALARALAGRDPEAGPRYRRRAAAYAQRLRSVDRRVHGALAPVPPERRKLVTSHESLRHFARRYRLEFVGAPFGLAPEAEASAAEVARLIDQVESQGVPAVFADATDDPELMREIARETGVEVVDDLLVEGFAGEVDSYEELLLTDARRIAAALAP